MVFIWLRIGCAALLTATVWSLVEGSRLGVAAASAIVAFLAIFLLVTAVARLLTRES
jgi:hypothetical protein